MNLLMSHSENSAVGYYRIWQQAKQLKLLGHEVRTLPDQHVLLPNDEGIAKTTVNKELKANHKKYGSWESLSAGIDMMVMQRADQAETIALSLAIREQSNCPIVFEIDDNIYDVSTSSPSYRYWYPGSPLFEIAELFMSNVDALTVSTPELVDAYKHLNPNIYVLPNCQDPDDWEGIERPTPEDKLVIGWAGSNTHYDDLHMIRRVIKKILRNNPNVVFRVIGSLPDFLEGVPGVEFRRDVVGVRKWPAKLAELNFDIGLAPVVDRPFNRSKSNIKWQEYAMLGIPTVASNIGAYKEIQSGVTGFTADSEAGWLAHIQYLINNPELADSVGEQAKQYVLDNHNIQKNIGAWESVYEQIIKDFHGR